ncbi:MFS transporter [Consotaella aegiceratis]|uniref:MFS transporter n=1 Tax=Consotaella aegiceratis TaxID=3097961 RepID=UPI002F4007F7
MTIDTINSLGSDAVRTDPRDPARSVSAGFIVGYGIAYVGLFTALMTPVAITMAIRISAIDTVGKGASLGTILGIGALFALIANPLFGQISDITTSRFGRRRPWLFLGTLIGLACALVIAASDSLFIIGLAWCISQIAYNAALAAIVAVVPDRVPECQRGKISAISGMGVYLAILIGSAILSLVGPQGVGMFLWPALIGFLAVNLFAFFLNDKVINRSQARRGSLLTELGSAFWVNPRKAPDFAWAWFSRFLLFLGVAVLLTYQVYYLTDHLKVEQDRIGQLMFFSTLVTAVCVVLSSSASGWLSDRWKRRKIFVFAAAVVYAIGLAVITAASAVPLFLVGIAVSSLGLGVYMAVDQALVVDVLPDRETNAGKNMGVLNIANAVPQSIAPAVAPLILSIGSPTASNYPLLFAVAAACAFLGALAIAPVKGVR